MPLQMTVLATGFEQLAICAVYKSTFGDLDGFKEKLHQMHLIGLKSRLWLTRISQLC